MFENILNLSDTQPIKCLHERSTSQSTVTKISVIIIVVMFQKIASAAEGYTGECLLYKLFYISNSTKLSETCYETDLSKSARNK